jgi:hypothetical protein
MRQGARASKLTCHSKFNTVAWIKKLETSQFLSEIKKSLIGFTVLVVEF